MLTLHDTVPYYDVITTLAFQRYVLVCNPPSDPNADPTYHLASINVMANEVVSAPTMQLVKAPPNVKELFVLQLALAQ